MVLDISNGYLDLDLAYKKTSKKLLGHYAGLLQIIVGQLFLNGVLKSLTDTYKNILLHIKHNLHNFTGRHIHEHKTLHKFHLDMYHIIDWLS